MTDYEGDNYKNVGPDAEENRIAYELLLNTERAINEKLEAKVAALKQDSLRTQLTKAEAERNKALVRLRLAEQIIDLSSDSISDPNKYHDLLNEWNKR